MALDGVAVCALVKEFSEKLVGLRIDKIYQPEHDEIHITLHGFGNNYRLLFSYQGGVFFGMRGSEKSHSYSLRASLGEAF